MATLDVIIVGGGPAGLNAAVVLGRCRRSVLVFDSGSYRNRKSHGIHNYLTRDDILPGEFLKLCHKEIEKYGVQLRRKKVIHARKNAEGLFEVRDEDHAIHFSRKLLIATGVKDTLPPVKGFAEMYGQSVFHCPYCDGWEVRDKKLGVYARNKAGWELALALKGWSQDVTLYTDGRNNVKPFQKGRLDAHHISVVTWPWDRMEGKAGQLEKIVFRNGREILCDALFFVNGYAQQCDLVETFGCELSRKGVVKTNRYQQTQTPGLFVAGDADKDMQFVVIAAAEGAKAGVIINKELQQDLIQRQIKKSTA